MEKTHTQKRIEQMREELRLGHSPNMTDILWTMSEVEKLQQIITERELEIKLLKEEREDQLKAQTYSRKPFEEDTSFKRGR